ncbi:MAG: anti-sigma factor family protein [Acidimicrobiia bacterium]
MDCSEANSMLDELALDVLPGDRRAALLAHVEECPNCRHLLDQLSETADALLLGGPVTTPAAGFDDRVLANIAGARSRGRGWAQREWAQRARAQVRLPVSAVAAAAAVLLMVGGLGGALIGRSSDGGEGSGRRFRTVNLIAAGGADVGDVSTYYGRSPWYFMQLKGALPDGTYQCVLELDDGRSVPLGRIRTVGGQGGWGDRVTVDAGHATVARLVDSQGNTVATARLR